MIRFLFKQSQPRRFDFKPRYYDADREALNARIEFIKKEMAAGDNSAESLRGQFSSAWRKSQHRSAGRNSNRNVMLIATVLFALAYLVLFF